MEEPRRLEKLQSVVSAVSSRGLLTSDHESSSSSSSRFISDLVLFLVSEKVEWFFEFFPGEF